VSGFDFPDFEQPQEYLALRSPDRYAIEDGSFVSSSGISFDPADFDLHVREEHVARSNALHARLHGVGSYVVGPMARYAVNRDLLSPLAAEAAAAAGLGTTCRNPFRSIIVRAVELVYACDEALRIVAAWEPPAQPAVDVPPRAGVGTGATEAPRGVLWHRYRLAADGTIRDARIVPPTSQNQASIEKDMRSFVANRLELPADELTRQCEQAIRNYDPCISCATHFPAPAGGTGVTGGAGIDAALVVGIGNPLRGDDRVGPAVAALVRARAHPGVQVAEVHADPSYCWTCGLAAVGSCWSTPCAPAPRLGRSRRWTCAATRCPAPQPPAPTGSGWPRWSSSAAHWAGCRLRSSSSGSNWARSGREPPVRAGARRGAAGGRESTSWSRARRWRTSRGRRLDLLAERLDLRGQLSNPEASW
jgi:hypothetical protein